MTKTRSSKKANMSSADNFLFNYLAVWMALILMSSVVLTLANLTHKKTQTSRIIPSREKKKDFSCEWTLSMTWSTFPVSDWGLQVNPSICKEAPSREPTVHRCGCPRAEWEAWPPI